MKLNKDLLPVAGIVAFSGCSVNAVGNLLFERAKDDTPLFWAAAILIELCTAWLVWSVVENLRKITKSNISKQDRKFYSIVLVVFLVLAVPSLTVSVVANVIEFGGSLLLGLLFPVLSVACAVGAGIPETVKEHARECQAVSSREQADRKARQEARKKEQERRKQLSSLGKAKATFVKLCQDPGKSQSTIAQELSVSRQAVGNHMSRLEQLGAIKRNGGDGVEVLWDIAI